MLKIHVSDTVVKELLPTLIEKILYSEARNPFVSCYDYRKYIYVMNFNCIIQCDSMKVNKYLLVLARKNFIIWLAK